MTYPTQSRTKSIPMYAGLISLLILLGDNYNVWGYIGMDSAMFTQVLNLAMPLLAGLVGFGVAQNPTNKNGF